MKLKCAISRRHATTFNITAICTVWALGLGRHCSYSSQQRSGNPHVARVRQCVTLCNLRQALSSNTLVGGRVLIEIVNSAKSIRYLSLRVAAVACNSSLSLPTRQQFPDCNHTTGIRLGVSLSQYLGSRQRHSRSELRGSLLYLQGSQGFWNNAMTRWSSKLCDYRSQASGSWLKLHTTTPVFQTDCRRRYQPCRVATGFSMKKTKVTVMAGVKRQLHEVRDLFRTPIKSTTKT